MYNSQGTAVSSRPTGGRVHEVTIGGWLSFSSTYKLATLNGSDSLCAGGPVGSDDQPYRLHLPPNVEPDPVHNPIFL